MTMGATLAWPAMAVLGFVVLTSLVVALGTSSTARYEFEHNGTRERQRAGAAARAPTLPAAAPGAGGRVPDAQAQPQAVDVAVRPAPAAVTGGPGWWLVDDRRKWSPARSPTASTPTGPPWPATCRRSLSTASGVPTAA